jgi:hypothetical protein
LLRPLDAVIVIFCSLPVPLSGLDVDDAVGVDASDLDLRRRALGGSPEMELAERCGCRCHRALALHRTSTLVGCRPPSKTSLFFVGIVVLR